jgi:two-component system, LytTR family, sensor kinase
MVGERTCRHRSLPSATAVGGVPRADGTTERLWRWRWILIVWLVPAVIASLQSAAGAALRSELGKEWPFAALQFPRWMTWALFTPIVFGLHQRAPLSAGRLPRFVGVHASASIMLSALLEMIWLPITMSVAAKLNPNEPLPVSMTVVVLATLVGRIVPGAFTYAAVLGVAASMDAQRRLRAREVRTAELETELVQSQLSALKMQLHPHFLFNTLHAVTVLIQERPTAAIKMVARLGDLLRLTLTRTQQQEVPLASELELVRLYLDIEQVRFADRLAVTYEIPANLMDAAVPDLLLQPLVENAIKHGIARHAGRGSLTIVARRLGDSLEINVHNSGGATSAVGGSGVGIAVTRRRLNHLYGETATFGLTVNADGASARVVMPFRGASDGAPPALHA